MCRLRYLFMIWRLVVSQCYLGMDMIAIYRGEISSGKDCYHMVEDLLDFQEQ